MIGTRGQVEPMNSDREVVHCAELGCDSVHITTGLEAAQLGQRDAKRFADGWSRGADGLWRDAGCAAARAAGVSQ